METSERLKQLAAMAGIMAVAATAGPLAEDAGATRPNTQGPHLGKPVRGAQGIGTAIAIGISGNRPVR